MLTDDMSGPVSESVEGLSMILLDNLYGPPKLMWEPFLVMAAAGLASYFWYKWWPVSEKTNREISNRSLIRDPKNMAFHRYNGLILIILAAVMFMGFNWPYFDYYLQKL